MPAQGRGAFLVPRAAPRPAAPRRQQGPPPALAQVIHHAVTQAAQVTHPAVVAAQHVAAQAPPIVRHANAPAARAQKGLKAPLSHTRGEVSDGLLRATIMQNPLLRANLEGDLNAAQLNARAQVRQIRQQQAEAGKHGGPLDLGFVNLTPLATTLATGAEKLGIGQALGGVPGKLLNEAIDLPGQSFLSSAQLGLATRRAFEGNTKPIEGLGSQVLQQILHPVRSFEQAPLSTALLFAGGENALGSLAGHIGRLGEKIDRGPLVVDDFGNVVDTTKVARQGLIPAFSRERPDLQLYGDLAKMQRYNRDPLRKAGQVALERVRARGGQDPFQATGRRLHRELVGAIVKPGRVDYLRQAGERTRRQYVNTVKQAALGVVPANGRDAVPLIYQGVVRTPRTLVADLQKERAKLEAAVQGDHGLLPEQVSKNRENLARVEALLGDKKFLSDPSAAFHAADVLKAASRHHEAVLVHGGVLRLDALRAKLFPYAQAHMGAEYAEEINPHEQIRYDAAKAEHGAATKRVANLEAEIRATTEGRGVATGAREAGGADLHKLETDSVQKTMAHRAQLAELAKASRDRAAGKITDAQHEAIKAKTDATGEARTQGIDRVMRAREGSNRVVEGQHAQLRGLQQRLEDARRAERETSEQVPAKPVAAPGLRKAGGGLLTDQEILDHMHANGVHDVGFMSHQPGQDSPESFYKATTRLPNVYRHTRTGTAFENGTAPQGWEHLVGSVARKASDAAQLEVRARELSQLALHPREGGFESKAAAEAFARNAAFGPHGEPLPNGLGDLKAVHLGPKEIGESGVVNPRDLHETLERFGLHNEESLVKDVNGTYGLIPREVEKRLIAHDEAITAKSNVARGAQAYQNAFRAAKLNTSTRHIFGVAAEQAIRLGAEGVAPALRIPEELRLPRGRSVSTGALGGKVVGGRAARAGAKFDEHLKRAAELDHNGHLLDDSGPLGSRLRELEAQLGTRGGQVTGYQDMKAIRAAKRWSDTSRTAQTLKAGERVMHETLPGKAALKTWHGWSAIVEGSLTKIEHGTHYAMLGKALKDTGFIDNYREVLKAQDKAMHDMVAGRLSKNQADAIARKVDDMMGNWSHLTPTVRSAVAYLTPFGLWWLNSMRWLYRLPVTHPIKTGIAAAVYNATRQARNAEGQGFDAPSAVPDWLQGTIGVNIPGLGPGHINPTYYSPGGIGGPDFWKTAIEQIAPQFAGPVLAGLGLNPLSLEKLKDAQGAELGVGAKGANVLAELLTGPVPGATQAQQALQSGGKPYGTANILTDLLQRAGGPAQTKPGTQRPLGQVLEKMLLPERYAYDTGFTGAGASGGGKALISPAQKQRLQGAHPSGGPLISPVLKERLRKAREGR